jgi:predicted Holliday junction resolvase-like endonuclease
MVELFTFIISLILLIVFLVMAINIGSIVKILRRIETNSNLIKNSFERLSDNESQKNPSKMTLEEKARAFDQRNK